MTRAVIVATFDDRGDYEAAKDIDKLDHRVIHVPGGASVQRGLFVGRRHPAAGRNS